MSERFCIWQFEEFPGKLDSPEKCSELDGSNCPYTIKDVIFEKGCPSLSECQKFIPLDNWRDYIKKIKD
jgi:hypothetical protein